MSLKRRRDFKKTRRNFLVLLMTLVLIWLGAGCRRTALRCPNVAPSTEIRQAIEEALRDNKLNFPEVRPPGSVTVPVYFHILTSADGKEGLVSAEAIQLQIQVLNNAFAGGYGAGATTPFRFVYADTDTKANDAWFDMKYEETPTAEERAAKAALNKGGRGALNIYTANVAGDTLGWGRFPWNYAKGVDGIVIRYSSVPGGSEYPNNQGDTATHEVGHWLGLFHTYEGNCENEGDSIEDTPPGKDAAKGCPEGWDSCPKVKYYDAVHNYMNATDDACMNQFTRDQSIRMDDMHRMHRT